MAETVGVLGLARSGRAAALLALAAGESVFASDAGSGAEVQDAAAVVRQSGGEAETGGHTVERLAACDLLVLSPGIPPDAAVLRDPRLARVPRISELEFAFRHLRTPVVAITGTNGKSTVTAMTAHLLKEGGLNAVAAGNIGLALSEVALRHTPPDWAVVECSSFQLAEIDTFAPQIGVVTNLAPDHLDRYAALEAYYADKARLFANASETSRWVLNGDDARVLALPGNAPGQRFLFRVAGPLAPGQSGGFIQDGMLTLRLGDDDLSLVDVHELRILGAHNVANALAASLAAALAGAGAEALRSGLRDFGGLEHRLEVLGEHDGVLWINDSKATNVASTLVALQGMTRPTVLLLGGRHKGEPYTMLLPALRDRVRAVVAYGEAAAQVQADLGGHVPVTRVDGDFATVVARAAALARPGDVLLLSPACSSYDMFSDFEERGRQFRELMPRVGDEPAPGGEVPRGA